MLQAIISTNENPEDRCTALHGLGTLLFNASINLSTPKAMAEQEEAKQCFQEVIASYPDATNRWFKPANHSVAVQFEMENLAIGKIEPELEGKGVQNADIKLNN